MKIHNIQYREYYDGELTLTVAQIKAPTLEQAKQELIYSKGIKPSRILKEGAWR